MGSREIETSNFVLGLSQDRSWLWFGASLSPGIGSEDPLWGGAWVAVAPEARRGDWRYGVDAAGQFYGQDDPLGSSSGIGAGAELVPRAAFALNPALTLGAGGGGQVYYSGFGADSTAFTRTVGVVEGYAVLTPAGSPLQATGTVRRLFAEEDQYTLVEAAAQAARGRLAAWASVGTWLNEFIDGTPWEAGVAVRVLDRAWIRGDVAHEAFDPLYLTDERTTWSVGVSLLLGTAPRRSGETIADLPAPVQPSDGAELSVGVRSAPGPVSVAGDFTDWQVVPMSREGEDWVYHARLEPGVYRYAFVDGDGEWFVPEGTPGRTPDGMGGWVAVLIVDG